MITAAQNLGFKKLTSDNWLECDSGMSYFVRVRDGVATKITGEQWVEAFLAPTLHPSVPLEVRKLFEVARGAFCYGYFFYPLFALGIEQLYRVLETAARFRCSELGASASTRHTFKWMINWLHLKGEIPNHHLLRWEAGRHLRNHSSHPEKQSIYFPTDAGNNVRFTAELIDELFREKSTKSANTSSSTP